MSKMALAGRAAVSNNYDGDSMGKTVKELQDQLKKRREAEDLHI